jgi:conjugal transfer/entry exclusion protein
VSTNFTINGEEHDMESSGGGGNPLDRVSESLQKALDDLRGAGEKATGDVRTRIDDAVKRLNDASEQARSGAADQASSWRDTLDKATEDVRIQLGKLAVKAQTSDEALDALTDEIKARRKELG